MRKSIGLFGGITVLVIGVFAIGRSADLAKEPAVTNGSAESAAAYNMSEAVFEGVAQAGAPGVVWAGVAAFVVLALGLLLVAGTRGGR